MATKAQQIFKEKFDMTLSIKKIYEELPLRKQQLAKSFLHQSIKYSLTVIGILKEYSHNDLSNIIENFSKQSYQNKKLILLIDDAEYENNKKEIDALCQASNGVRIKLIEFFKRKFNGQLIRENKIGRAIDSVFKGLPEGELVSILPYNESLFSEHYSSLIRAFEDNDDLEIAYSNILLTHQDSSQKQFFDLKDKVTSFDQDYNSPNGFSRFVIKVKNESWMNSTLKYLGWGVMDAIYIKSKHKIRIARASSTVDIQSMPYSPDNMALFERDRELVFDSMNDDELKNYSFESYCKEYLQGKSERKITLDNYTLGERRYIMARLIDAIGLPHWIRAGLRRLYRGYIK